jgi:phage shock protein A
MIMAEPIFLRVRRVLSASVEDAVDSMERAGGTSVMREAIREIDRALDEVKAAQENAAARVLQAKRQQKMFRERVTTLEEKARFALNEGREDLAEAAISRQIDFEQQAERLETVQANADEEAKRLEECVTALDQRKKHLEDELEAFELAQRDAALGGEGPCRNERHVERKVARAEQAFDRAMAGVGGGTISRGDAQAAARVAEIEVIQKSSVIAQRLAALRTAA